MTSTDSTESAGQRRRGRRTGCYVFLIALGVLLAGVLVLAGVAYWQNQRQEPEVRTVLPRMSERSQSPPEDGPEPAHPAEIRRGRLEVDLSVAQLIVVPGQAGEPMRLDAEYDPHFYELVQTGGETLGGTSEETSGEPWSYHVHFAPTGSSVMALLRVKLGAQPPTVRLTLPRDVSVSLVGEVHSSFAALELGGLRVETIDLEVSGGAVAVSFLTPLQEPMDDLSMVGDKGSVKVVGLGNASPRTAFFLQHLGELDLDLRGAWVRDAEIDARAYIAGGTVWLPRNVEIEGLDGRRSGLAPVTGDEIPRPRLRVTPTEYGGRLVFID